MSITTRAESGPVAEAVRDTRSLIVGDTWSVTMPAVEGVTATGGATIVQTAGTVYGTMVGSVIIGGTVSGSFLNTGGEVWIDGRRVDTSPVRLDPVEITIILPAGSTLRLDTVSACTRVDGNPLRLLDVTSISGDVEIANATPRVRAKVTSGDVIFAGAEDASVSTVSGDIRAASVAGDLCLNSVSGDIRVHAVRPACINASTVSGDVDVTAPLSVTASVQVAARSVSGHVHTPGRPAARA